MNIRDLNIVFMGTPEFAVPTLERLHSEYGVKAVVTVPDKPQGRGMKLTPSAVKISAEKLSIPVLQPESLKDETFIENLKEYNPDIIVVVAFRILPKAVYEMSKIGTFNIHGSLLPKYRGAAPINWAILNGEKVSGLTSFLLQEKVDTGEMLLQKHINITDSTTAGDLHDALMPLAAELAYETCELLISGNFTPIIQDGSLATPAPKLFRENCQINWQQDSESIRRFIHGHSPIPCAWTKWDNKMLKIYRIEVCDNESAEVGKYEVSNYDFIVHTNDKSIRLLEIQLEGKKQMKTEEFLKGYRGNLSGFFL